MTTLAKGDFRYKLTDAQWRKKLNSNQYAVLRQAQTERPFTSPLDKEKRKGMFRCAGCDWPLYASNDKFESGTGWPSFSRPYDKRSIGTAPDNSFFGVRTEVHCANCGGHLGHVFNDGPPPTGQRWCMNGVAMVFRPG